MMKKYFTSLFVLLSLCHTAAAQHYVKVHTNGNATSSYTAESIDSITFVHIGQTYLNLIYGKAGSLIDSKDIQAIDSVTFDMDNEFTIDFRHQTSQEGFESAYSALSPYLGSSKTAQYCLRGGKNGDVPGAHAYEYQYGLGPDCYANYMTIPHRDFMFGTLTSTYNNSTDFNGDPRRSYTMVKNALMRVLNHPQMDSIPEVKAINLLYYCISAQEMADLSGPFTYFEDKHNSVSTSFYNDVETIYKDIVQNLDTIVACLRYHETRPSWYKERVRDILMSFNETNRDLLGSYTGMTTYIKLANSLKLRMAMHIVKRDPALAQKWAEEAVRDGVVESIDEQSGLFPVIIGFSHPLTTIIDSWGDSRISASFESLLMSLDHPYTKYLIKKNSNEITNVRTGEVLPANSKIVGIRSGTLVGDGQTYGQNQRIAYSGLDRNYLIDAPLYLLKFAEVDFLRAEGALRGWNMGGTAQYFYERGIRNAYLEEPWYVYEYNDLVEAYMQREEPVAYVQSDPMGDGEDWPSVTKIGVKWNDADSKETKLEKIITQKYIALFPLSTEAWTELRRTGYPKCFPVLNTNDGDGSIPQGELIRRIPWQSTDPIELEKINTTGIPALGGPDKQATRLWWDVDAPNF